MEIEEEVDEAMASIDCGRELERLTKGMSFEDKMDFYARLRPKIRYMKPSERLAYFRNLK